MYKFIYRCRLCGKSFRHTGASCRQDTVGILEETMWAERRDPSVPPKVLHWCETDNHGAVIEMGIADLIGAKFTPEK